MDAFLQGTAVAIFAGFVTVDTSWKQASKT